MSEEARVAYIDGVAVPRILARSQWEPLFPNLIRGVLREHRDGGAFICPDAEGTFILDGGKEYVIYFQSLGAGDVQSHMSDSNASYDSSRSHGPVTISSLAESNGLSATSTPGSGGSGSLTQKKALYMRPPTLRPLDNALTNTETVDVLPSQTAIKHCDAQGQESENPAHVRAGDDVGNISIAPYSRPPENNVDLLCGKYLQDRVHEYVFLPALAVKIMDTPEFQHLRSLKQLGPTDYIYPSTTHTRFEHSIGVAHLASELLVCIARRQPELKINKKDILSVVVAGLCHDLGHGPFSHLFENLVNRYRAKKGEKEVFSHENMSIRLLRRILSRISLDQFGLDEDDARFIELCIVGLSPGTPWPTNVGRSPEKRFLVDVIANKRNGVDMDRLDYFMRDSIACYGRAAFDVHIPRLFSASKVFCFEGEHQICFEEKTALSLVKMFTVRANLHKHVYQHRVVVVLCHMISDALLEAESHLSFRGSNNKTFTLAESVNDDEAYCKLGDWIVDFIAASTSKELEKARFIIDRIYKRDLYRVAGSAIFKEYRISRTKEDILNEMLEICERMYNNSVLRHQLQSLLIVDLIRISFGSEDINGKADNPVKKVTFFSPKNFSEGPFKLSEEHISPLFSPSQYGELSLVVIVRESAFLNEATAIFKKWKSENHKHLCVAVPVHNTRSEITSQNSPIRGSFGSTSTCLDSPRSRARLSGSPNEEVGAAAYDILNITERKRPRVSE